MTSNTSAVPSSHNHTQTVKKFITPSWSQLMLYLVISLIILFILNSRPIWSELSGSILLSQSGFNDLVQPGSQIDKVWQSISNSKLPLIVFWATIGCLIYLFIWFSKSLIVNLQNDMIADLYQHPKTYSRSDFWAKVLGHKALFVVTVGVTILFAFAMIVILPLISRQAFYSVKYYESPLDVLNVIVIVAGTILMLHIFILLVHVSINMWKIIYRDL